MENSVLATAETLVGLLLAVSIASERLVEIIKGIVPWLNSARPDPLGEGHRRAALQFLAVASGVATTFLAAPCGCHHRSQASDGIA